MGIAYSASDLIISRAGATAISEIISLGKASILIPYPYAANNHQEINARILEENNASLMLKEEQLKNGELEKIITMYFDNKIGLMFCRKKYKSSRYLFCF